MQNNSECCNNNCNQGRNCPLRAATPAADMGNPVSQLNQHVAAPVVLPEPFALYDGEKWYANEEAAICSCADMAKLQKVFIESQLRALLAGVSAPAGAKPVAWLHTNRLGGVQAFTTEPPPGLKEECQPLYTAPQQADARDAEQERWMEIGKAIERACIDQPDSTEIVISLERDAGTVTMVDPDGNEHDQFSHEDGFTGVLNAAIEAAIASAKENEK